jgi:hypothetical protein
VSVYLPDKERGGMRWSASVPATRTAPIPGDPNRPSEIALAPDGRFLYVANRSADTVAVFAVEGPRPTHLGEVPTGGIRPRHIALAGPRIYVANERSAQITMLSVDPESGWIGDPRVVAQVKRPTCVLIRGWHLGSGSPQISGEAFEDLLRGLGPHRAWGRGPSGDPVAGVSASLREQVRVAAGHPDHAAEFQRRHQLSLWNIGR